MCIGCFSGRHSLQWQDYSFPEAPPNAADCALWPSAQASPLFPMPVGLGFIMPVIRVPKERRLSVTPDWYGDFADELTKAWFLADVRCCCAPWLRHPARPMGPRPIGANAQGRRRGAAGGETHAWSGRPCAMTLPSIRRSRLRRNRTFTSTDSVGEPVCRWCRKMS